MSNALDIKECVEVEALVAFNFDHQTYLPGDQFEVKKYTVDDLLKAKLIRLLTQEDVTVEEAVEVDDFQGLLDIDAGVEEVLYEADYTTVELLKKATKADLVALPKIGEATAKKILKALED